STCRSTTRGSSTGTGSATLTMRPWSTSGVNARSGPPEVTMGLGAVRFGFGFSAESWAGFAFAVESRAGFAQAVEARIEPRGPLAAAAVEDVHDRRGRELFGLCRRLGLDD